MLVSIVQRLRISPVEITVGARGSRLSKIQTQEVLSELQIAHPNIRFSPFWVQTTGDRDKKTPLWKVHSTDFFTKEIDKRQLSGEFRISIHSAKDLPSSLPDGLEIIAITKGISPLDSLVMRDGMTVENLPKRAKIGTSSKRRIDAIHALRSDFQAVDIRGNIEERLLLLEKQLVDALIIAEAALIRLSLTFLNRIQLRHVPEPLQGKLAVIALSHDEEAKKLFAPLDARTSA